MKGDRETTIQAKTLVDLKQDGSSGGNGKALFIHPFMYLVI